MGLGSRLPWWSAFPLSGGFGLVSIFAPDAFPDWLRIALFWCGVCLLATGMLATGWHYRPKRWLSRNLWWRFAKVPPHIRPADTPEARLSSFDNSGNGVDQVGETSSSRAEAQSPIENLGYAYPKAVLKAEIDKPTGTRSAHSGQEPHAMSIMMAIRNDHHKLLRDCSIILIGLTESGQFTQINEPLHAGNGGKFTVAAKQPYKFTFLSRDISDRITPHPFVLKLVDRELPLEEETVYVASMDLHSIYKWPTQVTARIETGKGLEAKVEIIDMRLPDAANG